MFFLSDYNVSEYRKLGSKDKIPQQPSSNVKAWSEEAKKNYNNPNYVWEFNNGELTTFGRGRDRKKRAKRMGRFGAKARIGITGVLGSGVLGTAGYIVGGKKGAMIGAGLGGALGTAGSYLEHRNSAYSPIGKSKWKNYKQPPKMYGISTDKLDLIGE